jgi:hypothetical protein
VTRRSHLDPAAFERRVLQDAYLDGCAAFWERRARQLEAARPRRGDYPGRATPEQLRARWHALTEAATACRNRAAFIDAATAEYDDAMYALDQHRGAAA